MFAEPGSSSIAFGAKSIHLHFPRNFIKDGWGEDDSIWLRGSGVLVVMAKKIQLQEKIWK